MKTPERDALVTNRPLADEGIGALITRLIDDAKEFVGAEIALYRVQLTDLLSQAKSVAIYGVAALLLMNAAVIALIVGLLLTLQPHLGPGWATLVVVLGTLAVAALLGWLAWVHVRRMLEPKAVK